MSEHQRTPANAFRVVYAPERAQYVVERGVTPDRMRVVPSVWPAPNGAKVDADAKERAAALCVALNRVYVAEPSDAPSEFDVQAPGGIAWDEHDDDANAPY